MAFFETTSPKIPVQGGSSNNAYRFDYPEIFVLILTVILLAIHYNFSPTSMALAVVVCLPSLLILIYNYRRPASFWTSNIVIILSSAVIGSIQFCAVISLSLAALIGMRIILSSPENHLKLLAASVVTVIVFYYVSVTLNSTEMDCHDSFVTPAVLLASMIVILCHFRHVYRNYVDYERERDKRLDV